MYPTAQHSDPIRVGQASVDPPGDAYVVPHQLHSTVPPNTYPLGYPNPSDPAVVSGNMVPTAVNPNTVPKYDVGSDQPVCSFFPEARGTGPFDVPVTAVLPPTHQLVPPVSVENSS